jgi:hypothetical protein
MLVYLLPLLSGLVVILAFVLEVIYSGFFELQYNIGSASPFKPITINTVELN